MPSLVNPSYHNILVNDRWVFTNRLDKKDLPEGGQWLGKNREVREVISHLVLEENMAIP